MTGDSEYDAATGEAYAVAFMESVRSAPFWMCDLAGIVASMGPVKARVWTVRRAFLGALSRAIYLGSDRPITHMVRDKDLEARHEVRQLLAGASI